MDAYRKSTESQLKAIINLIENHLLCCLVAIFVLLAYSPRKSKIFFVLIPLFYIFAGEIENIGNIDHLDPLEILDPLENLENLSPLTPKPIKKTSSCHFLSTLLFPRSRR